MEKQLSLSFFIQMIMISVDLYFLTLELNSHGSNTQSINGGYHQGPSLGGQKTWAEESKCEAGQQT